MSKMHFAAGLLIAISAGFLISPAAGLALAMLGGVVKEWWDWLGYNGPDWKDAVATSVGGAVGFVIVGWLL